MPSTITPTPARQLQGWDNGDGTFTSAGAPAVAGSPVLVSSSGVNSTVTATMPAVAGKTNHVTGILVTSSFPSSATSTTVTITGLTPAPLTVDYSASAQTVIPFNPPISVAQPAQRTNLAVTVSCGALGAGVNVSVMIFGFVV